SEFEAARSSAARASATILGWALRGADPNSVEGRRLALEIAAESGTEPSVVALERFGLESALGDPVDALSSLDALEGDSSGDLAVAAALARILWPAALEQRAAVDRALELLEERGDEALAIAHAERFRLARTMDQDRALAVAHAAAWASADPSLSAAL